MQAFCRPPYSTVKWLASRQTRFLHTRGRGDAARVTTCKRVCVCESYIGKPIGTRAVPQFTTGVKQHAERDRHAYVCRVLPGISTALVIYKELHTE